MNGYPRPSRIAAMAVAVLGIGSPLPAQDDPNLAPPGMQVLTQGPVHEAFAEPVIFDPRPGPTISKPPPQPVEELPPEQKPEGANVQWIPGYWAWDDGRNDYVWISGVWRDLPPGRQWVPGYWNQVPGGFQWTPGAWVPADQGQAQYLPVPPQSLEAGPNTPAPSPGATWSPGCWYWQDQRYVWRPGYWVPFQQDWVWVPAHYVWTPGGYLYVNGYWDRPLQNRGLAFAPVYFQQPLYTRPNYLYTPTVGLVASALLSSLFVRPAYHQYYFGDYYAASNFRTGIYPWYSFHQSRYGYDPLFSHYAAVNTRRDPRWIDGVHEEYRYRREHPEARPARTFVQQQSLVATSRDAGRFPSLVMARPVHQLAAGTIVGGQSNAAARFERLDEARRRALVQQSQRIQTFRQERLKQEIAAAKHTPAGAGQSVRTFPLPRSPWMGTPLNPGNGAAGANAHPHRFPPPAPTLPRVEPNRRTLDVGKVPQFRHEPRFDELPAHLKGGAMGPVRKEAQRRRQEVREELKKQKKNER